MPGPLTGIRVLDFSTLLPGPLATLILCEAGAEVIKVELPGRGDEMRAYTPRWGPDSVNFALLNRGKQSIALDLKDPEQRRQLTPLIRDADLLVEQFRPGVMARLELDYEAVRAINPRMIYCSLTGYGQSGPKRDRPGHDLNFIAETGLLSLSTGPVDRPVVPPALVADIAAGSYPLVINILLALRDRDHSGRGARIDISMTDNVFPLLYWAIGNSQLAGQSPGNASDLVTGASPRYHLYPTADGRILACAAIEQKFWDAFTEAIGLPNDVSSDADHPELVIERVAAIVASKPADHWQARLGPIDCCCCIVHTVAEALQDPHFIARGVFSERLRNRNGEELVALPVPLARAFRSRLGEAVAAPELGRDNDKWL